MGRFCLLCPRRFSDTFDLHQPLEGLPVTMAQLLAISHDIVARGQQQMQLQATQQQQLGWVQAAEPLQQQQVVGVSVEMQAGVESPEAAAAAAAAEAGRQTGPPCSHSKGHAAAGIAASPSAAATADAADAAEGQDTQPCSSQQQQNTPADSLQDAPLSPSQQQHSKRQKTQKQKAVELNPQQQRQADHIARQMQQLGVSSGRCACRPIRNARAGVVAFLPRNTDLQQLSELAGQCFCTLLQQQQQQQLSELAGQCFCTLQQQQQQGEALVGVAAGSKPASVADATPAQQQQQHQPASAAAAMDSSSGELPSVGMSSLCGDGNSGELQRFYSIDPETQHPTSQQQQQQQHDAVLARGPPERFFSIESTFSADYAGPLLHSLCSVEAHPLLAEAIAEAEAELEEAEDAAEETLQEGVVTESNKRQLPQAETACGAAAVGAAAAQQCTAGDAVLEAVAAAAAAAAEPAAPASSMYVSPAVAAGTAAAAAAAVKPCGAAGAAESAAASHGWWRVERNILNDHFKGVTVYCGWQE
jgi:hypothetical protein